MLKSGIGKTLPRNRRRRHLSTSCPARTVQSEICITSAIPPAIAGGDSPLVFEYADWTYGAEDDEEDTIEYPLGYFFAGDNENEDYVITAPAEQAHRQLSAQYPSQEEINRSAVMMYFDDEGNANINQMWINIRCFNISMLSLYAVAAHWNCCGCCGDFILTVEISG